MTFSREQLRGDLFGGLTAGVVALPLALAFGVASGLGATAGLYGAIAVGLFASILGGTATQVSGPTGPMTVVSATVIAAQMTAAGEPNIPVIVGTFILAGVFQIVMGLLGFGAYIRYVPYPVVSGFMTGIGVIIITLQLFPLFGRANPASHPLEIIGSLHLLGDGVNYVSTGLAALTIGLVYVFRRVAKKFPASLLSLIAASGLAYLLDLDVTRIGTIPQGLPKLLTPAIGLDSLKMMIAPALQLAFLGAIDSLLTSLVADHMTKTRHNSNRELVGQGIGNMVGGLIGGIPGAGATMRTVININAGGVTRLSGIIHAAVLIAILSGLGPLVGEIPLAVLAGILVTVGIAIMDKRGMRHIAKVPRPDAFLMILVLGLTVFADLMIAVAAGVILASFNFMKQISDLAEVETQIWGLGDVTWLDEHEIPESAHDDVLIKQVHGPLFFGFAKGFQELSQQLSTGKVVILRLDRVSYMDQTGLYALDDILGRLRLQGTRVIIAGIRAEHLEMLRRLKVIPQLISESDVFESVEAARERLSGILASQRGE